MIQKITTKVVVELSDLSHEKILEEVDLLMLKESKENEAS